MPNLKLYRKGSGKNSEFINILPIGTTYVSTNTYFLAEEKTITVTVSSSGTTSLIRPNEGDGTKTVKTDATYTASGSHTFDICDCDYESRGKEIEFQYQIEYQKVCYNQEAETEEELWTEENETETGTGVIYINFVPYQSEIQIGDPDDRIYDALVYQIDVVIGVGNTPPYSSNCQVEYDEWGGGIQISFGVLCTDKNVNETYETEYNIDEENYTVTATQTLTVSATLS